jgi:ribonuclease HI
MAKKVEKTTVYTDGSCDPNPGPGGWAAVILHSGNETILKGHADESTNNRMELTAALEALRSIDEDQPVILYTDSQYLKNGVESWLKNWKAKNWKRKGGKLANVDLWKQISEEIEHRKITWRWIKGHNGNPYNERADRIAQQMVRKIS